MDLSSIQFKDEGEWMEVEHPITGEPIEGMRIKLAGEDSEAWQKTQRKQQDKNLKKGFRNLTSEQLENQKVELLVSATLDWEGFELNGEKLDCTRENVRRIYRDKSFAWLRRQVDEFVGNEGNFLGES